MTHAYLGGFCGALAMSLRPPQIAYCCNNISTLSFLEDDINETGTILEHVAFSAKPRKDPSEG